MSGPVRRGSRTEATRLLCAGVYPDIDFRGRVIEQLVFASPELMTAVRLPRAQLPLPARSEDNGLDEVEGELADVAGEIDRTDRTGRAERGRLERLRSLLISGSTAAGGLASAVAVVQAIAQPLG
ncbi:hypothetical protein G3I60_38950 [Streptomyces sp. SID13666]|uniref:hypothetical protein n=1 Tax=unclassified Streptomyces TaxID=2593676 RepID=UPI0013BF8D7F|nr:MULTISPECIES: hypothetical protein [unclassified Streptomyces]NEA59980.1 hypothetical protein [Streptomyces sp. SID13666]NEA73004.1 hypothetical protein [Streptomyces sp. SID13588]